MSQAPAVKAVADRIKASPPAQPRAIPNLVKRMQELTTANQEMMRKLQVMETVEKRIADLETVILSHDAKLGALETG